MNAPLAVLIVEDSENDALLIIEELREGGYDPAFERVETREALQKALLSHWDVIIADYRLPNFSGMDALKLARERDPDIPFIIVSGQISEDTAVETMRAGAQDYVLKDNLARLAPAVDRELREVRVRRERRQAEEALVRSEQILQSTIDSSNAAIYLKEPDGRFVIVNKECARLFGTTKEGAIGRTEYDLLPREVADQHGVNDREVIGTCAAREYEEVMEEEDGVHTFVSAKFPVYDSAGTVYGVGGISTDITQRKLMEEALKDERRRLAALESISEAGLSTLELRDLLDRLVEQLASALNADASCLFVLDEEAKELVAYAAHNVPGLIGHRMQMTEGFIGEIIRQRRAVCLIDAQHSRFIDAYSEGAKTLLGAPLIVRDKIVGVARVQTFEERRFGEDEIRLLQAMADRAAMAIDNAELYEDLQRSRGDIEEALERQKHYSLLLQRALLPSMPEIGSGYDVAAEYVPVPFSGEIGGDFYDVFRVGECRAGVLIGDVSGKGLEAAAMAATTRSTIHAFVHETASAAEALARANSVLYSRQIEFESFATVFLVIIDLSTGELSYSSAGHPPPVLCRCDGTFEYLKFGQMPLAVMEAQHFDEHKECFSPGDRLLLYTDGISEARHGSELFDVEGIERVVGRCCQLDASDLAKDLLNEATQWAEGRLRDDAAVVVVARQPLTSDS